MKMLLVGPLWGNANHGAECGIYDALLKLGHEVSVWDYRTRRYRLAGAERNDLGDVDPNNPGELIFGDTADAEITLVPGAGLKPEILESRLWRNTGGSIRVLWNSEPIRLGNYRGRIQDNKSHFQVFFTFDESEIPLYRDIGIEASFLPQGFNPAWYFPQKLPASQRWPNHLCFVGSVGGKWDNRVHFLNRIKAAGFHMHVATIFDATRVNQVYNAHDANLNLGLYCPESGPVENLKAFGLQQRIFETIGSGKICITNEIPYGTNKLFEHGKHVLFYNAGNLEEVLRQALDRRFRKSMEQNILSIRDQHTYKARMERLLSIVGE
jgi:hypothetical protein